MSHPLVNFLCFQIGWLAAILGAAWGQPLQGPAYMALWLTLHLRASRMASLELKLVLASGLIGFAADSALVLGGWLAFPEEAALGAPSTVWMVALWMGFAATLPHALGWLRGRYLIAAALGALFGPLAYWGGAKLGAVALLGPLALPAIGIEWALGLPLLLALLAFLERRRAEPSTALPASDEGASS